MKHPTIIASIILTSALLISVIFICSSLRSLDEDIRVKSMSVSVPPFPGIVRVELMGTAPIFIENSLNPATRKPEPFLIQTNR
jgi:hypothetical protein